MKKMKNKKKNKKQQSIPLEPVDVKPEYDVSLAEEDKDYHEEESGGDVVENVDESTNDVLQSPKIKKKRKKVTDELKDDVPKKKKKYDNEFYKQPTAEELSQLKETETLFHSNLFRLQIEEMLNEVKIKEKYKRLYNTWFENLKKTIEAIPETEQIQFSGKKLANYLNICTPMPDVPLDTRGTFAFLKPSNIATVGSHGFDAAIGPEIKIDIMVEMPSVMFQKHDYQNYRYHTKRALYLAHVSAHIKEDIATEKTFVGSDLKPMIKIIPTGKLGTKVSVLIHISAEETIYKLHRFLPEKNSVRPGWYFNETQSTNEELIPTPYYNSMVLHDLTMRRINEETLKIIKEYPNLRDGIILLKIWLTQRELNKGLDAFNGHIVAMFTLYLLSIKKLNTFMSSYQVVRNVWNHLAQVNWCESGITMSQDEESRNRALEYQKHYECVFLDPTGYHNLTAYISKSTFSLVQREAELCLKHLDSVHANSFQCLFMRKLPFYRSFDHLICFTQTESLVEMVAERSDTNDKLNYGSNKHAQAVKIIVETLRKGLGDRVRRICVLPDAVREWTCKIRKTSDIGNIFIGLELNPESCFNIVDRGPEANLPEAIEFRNFWGNKSELRRFQDGSIREALVWSKGSTLCHRRVVSKRIVDFVLTNKLGIDQRNYKYVCNQVENLLKLYKIQVTDFMYGTGEEATLKVLKSFDTLEKDLMSLTDIPLPIHGVQGSSPVFRYTDAFPPLGALIQPHRCVQTINDSIILPEHAKVPAYIQPLEISLQLSTSGKWPDELEAIRKTKAAFHIQIAECLRKQFSLKARATYSHVDVLKDGYIFRLRVAHQKEIGLLKQEVEEDGVLKYRDNEESIELESKLFELPKLTSALHGLHSQQPAFGPTCCIVKRWLSSQLLDDSHIPDVVVELLVASMFLMSAPYQPPQMPQVAFLRMLETFSSSHWSTDPVIVNFNHEMTREEVVAVETLFASCRDILPPLFISTPFDQQRSLWTRKAPSAVILNRISALAKASLKLFEDQLFGDTFLDVRPMFRPPLTEYDCLIYLKRHVVPRKFQAVDVPQYTPLIMLQPYTQHPKEKIPVVDFDPVQHFLRELRTSYGEHALFFHDTYGGFVIGVLLKPPALQVVDFKVSNINCRRCNDDGKLVLNVSTMIQDFYVLGRGLVGSIDVRSKRVTLA